jgi:hypothetical protein
MDFEDLGIFQTVTPKEIEIIIIHFNITYLGLRTIEFNNIYKYV